MEEVEGCEVSEVEKRFEELELEIVMTKSEYKALEARFRALEAEKLAMEEEIRVLRREGDGGGDEGDVEEDRVFQLMVENEVLVCEKKKAESEVEVWKRKFEELQAWVDENVVVEGGEMTAKSLEASRRTYGSERVDLEDGLKGSVGAESSRSKDVVVNTVDLNSKYSSPRQEICSPRVAGTPPHVTFDEHGNGVKERNKSGMEYGLVSQARKQLEFKEDGSPSKKIAPSTPGGNRPYSLSVIDISDSDDDELAEIKEVLSNDNPGSRKTFISSDSVLGDSASKSFLKQAHVANNDQEDVDIYSGEELAFSATKRKRASNVVTSDSESSDDNIPISRVKRVLLQERKHDQDGSDGNGSLENATFSVADDITTPKRRLVRLGNTAGRGHAGRNSSQTSEITNDQRPNKDIEEVESEEVETESEGESLDGFIVSSSDVSESNDASSESNCFSDDDMNFASVLSTLQRNKGRNTNWKFEADMLASFGKDPEMCMRAVCALYRQQSSGEQISRGTFLSNARGFNTCDAFRGSKLAEFLTEGNPNGDLNKTVAELKQFSPEAIETCRALATRYSKQLFAIYKNKEDPLFLPS